MLAQPKRLALLVYLAVARPTGFHRRDTLLALFWPESDEAAARAALSRALHHLRQALGADVIVSRGDDDVAVDQTRLTADLVELTATLERGDAAAALSIYQSDFLEGFHLDGVAAFDQWVEAEGDRIRTAVCKAFTEGSHAAERAGDFDTSLSFARRVLMLAPYGEPAMLDVMRLLDAQGNRTGALLSFEAFAKRLRDDLETSPGPALVAEAERIRAGRPAAAATHHARTPSHSLNPIPVSPETATPHSPPAPSQPATSPAPRTAPRPSPRWHRAAPALLVATALLAVGWLVLGGRSAVAPMTVRFSLNIPFLAPPTTYGQAIALSPDGTVLVYVGRSAGRSQLFLRPLGQATARLIAGTEGGQAPFFSPDDRWIGYWARGSIWKVPVGGGEITRVADAWWMSGATWLSDDRIVVGRTPTEPRLSTVSASGGALRPLAVSHLGQSPVALPGGKLLLFTGDAGVISLMAMGDSAATPLGVTGSPVGVLDGSMIYRTFDGILRALPVDLARRRATGLPVRLLDGVPVLSAALAVSGTLVYIRRSDLVTVKLVDLSGQATPLMPEPRNVVFPAVSSNGRQVAFSMTPESLINLYDIASKTFGPLFARGAGERPAWAASGTRIGFTGWMRLLPTGKPEISRDAPNVFWIASDGSARLDTLAFPIDTLDARLREVTFSPDGRFAVIRNDARLTKRDLWLLPLGPSGARGKAVPFEVTPFNELMPRVSPDSRHLAWVSDASGSEEVYLRPFPGPGPKLQVSEDGGSEPVWAPDGRGIFYRAHGKFMLAKLSASEPLGVTERHELFDDDFLSSDVHQQYDVMPDGHHLLVLEPVHPGDQQGEVLFVVLGWQQELRQQMAPAITATAR